MPAPSLPKSLLSTTRAEFYDADGRKPEERSLSLTVKLGLTEELTELPPELKLSGSMFIVAPAGAVDSPQAEESDTILPTKSGWNHLLNGDGMVYRIDFQQGQPKYSSRLLKTVSYYADQLTQERYPSINFFSYGLTRMSGYVGICNQLNTAFLPIVTDKNKPERLLVTWDMGRPMEIDPATLDIIGPVGSNRDWKPMLQLLSQSTAMKSIMASAHPVNIPNSSEVITVNVVKSVRGILGLSRLIPPSLSLSLSSLSINSIRRKLLKLAMSVLGDPIDMFLGFLQKEDKLAQQDVFLVRWNGDTDTTESWRVILAGNRNIKIKQTIHEIGLTQDYVVFADTAFKITGEDILPTMLWVDGLEKWEEKVLEAAQFHRGYLTSALLKDTNLYIISRKQLETQKSGGTIIAKQVVLKNAAIAHYKVDYNNDGDKITLHAALNQSTDFAEFIRRNDEPVFKEGNVPERMEEIAGVFTDAMEVNRPATYVINAKTGHVEHEATLSKEDAEQYTWAMGIYAYKDRHPTEQFDDIYWTGFGAWPETLSQFVADLYKKRSGVNAKEREAFQAQIEEGLPTSLYRVHIDRSKGKPNISVEDHYSFPSSENGSYFGNSPQFIPKEGSTGSTEGYVVCPVNYSNHLSSGAASSNSTETSWSANTEFWIFDANNLQGGPIYRLSHSNLNLGMTVHTTWLKNVESPKERRTYDVRADFSEQVMAAVNYYAEKKPQEAEQLKELFENIYLEIERDQTNSRS